MRADEEGAPTYGEGDAVIADEAVEAGAEVLYRATMSNQSPRWDGRVHIPSEQRPLTPEELGRHDAVKERFRDRARAMLEAAEPLLTEDLRKELAETKRELDQVKTDWVVL